MKISRFASLAAAAACSAASLVPAFAVPPPKPPGEAAGGHPAGSGDAPAAAAKVFTPAEIAAATKEAETAIKGFKTDPGLHIELIAAEPLINNPVAFAEDEQGHWYVAETLRQEKGVEDNRAHGNWLNDDIAARTVEDRLAYMHKFYPDPKKFAEKFATAEDRVTRVDVQAKKVTMFADGFREPLVGTGAGVLARGKDVWWTCIPDLWRFRDEDGDGIAEKREKLLTGFGVHFAFRGHDMHGLRFGPDGKLYFSIGDRGIHVVTKEGKTISEPDAGTVMRCNPDGTEFEIFAYGVRNPQELAFDELGNLFTGDNNSDSGDKARFTYLVEGGEHGWRMTFQYLSDRGPWNREKLWDPTEALKAKYLVPPIANISNGPSGLTYNPGTGLSAKYNNKFFLADFRGGATASVIHEIALEPQGAFFKVKERRDFLKGMLNTDVEFGRDGGLYLLDWVASWGGVNKGRIYKFSDPAADKALQAETLKLISEGMSKRSPEELAKLLGHADQRVRQEAQFALADRGAASVPVLAKAAQTDGNKLSQIHALWGLGQLAKATKGDSLKTAVALLTHTDGEIRAQAARVLGDARYAPAAEQLTALLKDAAPRARMYAALALGKLGHAPAVPALFTLLGENNDADPVLRHAAVMGLAGTAKPAELTAKKNDPSMAVRVGALLSLRRQKSPEIAQFLEDKDSSIVLEAARAINDAPIEGAMPALAKLTTRKDLKDFNILSRVINANYRLGAAEHATALAVFAADGAVPENARRSALDALTTWGSPEPRDRILNLYRPLPARGPEAAVSAISATIPALLKDSPAGVQELVAKLVSKLNITSGTDSLFTLAVDAKAQAAPRIAALQALANLKDPRLPEVARAAVTDKNATLRTQGLQILSKADPAAAVKLIADIINTASTPEKQGALVALSQMKRPETAAVLGGLLDKLIAGGAQPEIQLDILEAAKRGDLPALNAKLKQYEASLPAGDPLAPYRVSLAGGNTSRGRKLFRDKVEVQCLRCHKCEIGDSLVGPDLTKIGASKDRQYLLEAIVFPNKKIAEGFETVVLTLKDNNITAGRLVKSDEKTFSVETVDEQGKPKVVVVEAAQVANRLTAPSPMPENIRDFLTKAELRDLVEYLATRK